MAKYKNQGTVNVDAVTNSILSNGGGINKGNNEDGSTHISVYSRTENRHISYDKDKDGNILESIQATMVILIWTIKAVSKRVKVEEIIKMRNNLVRLL